MLDKNFITRWNLIFSCADILVAYNELVDYLKLSYNEVAPTVYKEYLCFEGNMNTTQSKLSILAFMAVATTALTLGASTAFAASNTHTHHHIQLMSMSSEYFPTLAASNTHTHHHIQLVSMSSEYSPTLAASNTHTHHHIHVMSSGANSASIGPKYW
jgi:hypothetical protein